MYPDGLAEKGGNTGQRKHITYSVGAPNAENGQEKKRTCFHRVLRAHIPQPAPNRTIKTAAQAKLKPDASIFSQTVIFKGVEAMHPG